MEKKYKLREDLKKETLYHIEALRNFEIIEKGELWGI